MWVYVWATDTPTSLVFNIPFFFFQAEDGIRDLTVTGVQTCALPICLEQPPVARPGDFVHPVAEQEAAVIHRHRGAGLLQVLAVQVHAHFRRGSDGQGRDRSPTLDGRWTLHQALSRRSLWPFFVGRWIGSTLDSVDCPRRRGRGRMPRRWSACSSTWPSASRTTTRTSTRCMRGRC